jgi:hypothetical protein
VVLLLPIPCGKAQPSQRSMFWSLKRFGGCWCFLFGSYAHSHVKCELSFVYPMANHFISVGLLAERLKECLHLISTKHLPHEFAKENGFLFID